MVLRLHSSVTFRPQSVQHLHNTIDHQGQMMLRNKKKKQRKLIFYCSFATLVFFVLFSDVISSTNTRRRLSCQMRRMKHQEQLQRAGSSYHEDNYDSLQYGSSFAKIVQRMIARRMEESGLITTECETTFPDDIATIAGDAYYADTTATDSGLYYPEDAPIESDNADPENVDPGVLVPDIDEPVSYSSVDVALLEVYEPKVYVPTETDENDNTPTGTNTDTENNSETGTNPETSDPTANNPDSEEDLPHQDTIAYTVIITTCPLEAQAPESEVTDAGVDVYEATAITKQFVCNATDTAGLADKRIRRRRLTSENSGGAFTM